MTEYTQCNRSLGVGICPLANQCYDLWRTCDHIVDCADGYDEITCKFKFISNSVVLQHCCITAFSNTCWFHVNSCIKLYELHCLTITLSNNDCLAFCAMCQFGLTFVSANQP